MPDMDKHLDTDMDMDTPILRTDGPPPPGTRITAELWGDRYRGSRRIVTGRYLGLDYNDRRFGHLHIDTGPDAGTVAAITLGTIQVLADATPDSREELSRAIKYAYNARVQSELPYAANINQILDFARTVALDTFAGYRKTPATEPGYSGHIDCPTCGLPTDVRAGIVMRHGPCIDGAVQACVHSGVPLRAADTPAASEQPKVTLDDVVGIFGDGSDWQRPAATGGPVLPDHLADMLIPTPPTKGTFTDASPVASGQPDEATPDDVIKRTADALSDGVALWDPQPDREDLLYLALHLATVGVLTDRGEGLKADLKRAIKGNTEMRVALETAQARIAAALNHLVGIDDPGADNDQRIQRARAALTEETPDA